MLSAATKQNPGITVSVGQLRTLIAKALADLRQIELDFPDLKSVLHLSIDSFERALGIVDRSHSYLERRGTLLGTLTSVRVPFCDALVRHPTLRERSTVLCDVEQLLLARFDVVEERRS